MDSQVCECELEKEEELKINTIAVASKKISDKYNSQGYQPQGQRSNEKKNPVR